MRWQTGRRSQNVEDRRGMRVSPRMAGGGLGAIVIIVLALLFGVDPRMLTQMMPRLRCLLPVLRSRGSATR
jgi:predicted metalloprotease